MARLIIGAGIVLIFVGVVVFILGKLGFGSLPGDISFRRGNVQVFIPLGTAILLSLILTLVLNLLLRR